MTIMCTSTREGISSKSNLSSEQMSDLALIKYSLNIIRIFETFLIDISLSERIMISLFLTCLCDIVSWV